ncbi:MAG: phospho-N-acetylmuramoyl-pentapeptide-transferase [Candidatus Margulisiibacteriota bacterium]
MINQTFLFFSAAIVCFLITYPIVWALRFFHLTQAIREEGPSSHKAKAGTPTMGGIGFVLTIIVFAFIFITVEFDLKYLALILLFFGFAAIGLTDDLLKIIRKKNLGLTFWQKIVLQTLLAGIFSAFLIYLGHQQSVGKILTSFGFANPFFYFLLSVFMVVGTANATNLTDGLNGLLSGITVVAFLCFAVLAQRLYIQDGTVFCFAAAGAVLAFLYFNFPKAKVFMGDVGSLAIGAGLAGVAIVIHQELKLVIIGGIFVIEALSVILQVTSYKLWKKRIFRMTPLHHHFELMGIRETTVVVGFWFAGLVLGVIGILI